MEFRPLVTCPLRLSPDPAFPPTGTQAQGSLHQEHQHTQTSCLTQAPTPWLCCLALTIGSNKPEMRAYLRCRWTNDKSRSTAPPHCSQAACGDGWADGPAEQCSPRSSHRPSRGNCGKSFGEKAWRITRDNGGPRDKPFILLPFRRSGALAGPTPHTYSSTCRHTRHVPAKLITQDWLAQSPYQRAPAHPFLHHSKRGGDTREEGEREKRRGITGTTTTPRDLNRTKTET
ncbi:hypothetical protein VTK26DRAFT_9183 [Humicola hyalothermophila]